MEAGDLPSQISADGYILLVVTTGLYWRLRGMY